MGAFGLKTAMAGKSPAINFLYCFHSRKISFRFYIGSIISSLSQSEALVVVPQVMIPCRWDGAMSPGTIVLLAWAWLAGGICVCTVWATATVATKATAPTVAERIFILRDVILIPRLIPSLRGCS
jgi:hypothetical protein